MTGLGYDGTGSPFRLTHSGDPVYRLIGMALLLAASISLRWQSEQQKPAPSAAPSAGAPSPNLTDSRLGMDAPVRAEEVFKSIEIFKGKPAAQVVPAMNAIRGTLGVPCTYCHTQFEWEKMTSRPRKQRARCSR